MLRKKYTKEAQEGMLKEILAPENQMRSMSESTGLRIVDALYRIIDLLYEDEQSAVVGKLPDEKEVE